MLNVSYKVCQVGDPLLYSHYSLSDQAVAHQLICCQCWPSIWSYNNNTRKQLGLKAYNMVSTHILQDWLGMVEGSLSTERPAETSTKTDLNWFQSATGKTSLNQMRYSNQTVMNWLYAVWSSCPEKSLQLKPVAVAVAPDWGPKTRPNWTFKHYP